MDQLIKWVISGCLVVGVGPTLAKRTLEMAKAAVYAHQYDQMSYAKFTHALINAKKSSALIFIHYFIY